MTMTLDIQILPAGTTEAQESGAPGGVRGTSSALPIGEAPVVLVGHSSIGVEPESTESTMLRTVAYHEIEIGSLLDHRLRMSKPIILDMERENKFYIAKYNDLDEFGYGTDPVSAVQDFRKTIAELYWQLKEDEERVGSDLTRIWRKLTALVYEA